MHRPARGSDDDGQISLPLLQGAKKLNRNQRWAVLGLTVSIGLTLFVVFVYAPRQAGGYVAPLPGGQRRATVKLEQERRKLEEEIQQLQQELRAARHNLGQQQLQQQQQQPANAESGAAAGFPSTGDRPATSRVALTVPEHQNTSACLPVFRHQHRKPLHLVYLTSPVPYMYGGQISEAMWIRDVVLSGLSRPVIPHVIDEKDKHTFFLNDSLIVCLFLKRTMYLERARQAGVTNIGVYWMGDEKYQHDRSFIPLADYVFRNYWSRAIEREHKNVHWLPNGAKTGIGNHGSYIPQTLSLASQRRYLCNFVGSLRSHREEVINHLRQAGILQRCAVFVNTWEDKSSKHPILYRLNYLEQSKFTLTLWGNNPETMRLYEALDYASVPLSFAWKDPDTDVLVKLEPHPLPVFRDKQELVQFILRHERDPQLLDALQSRVMNWWLRRKQSLMQGAADVIEASFAKKYGPDS